MPGGPGEPMKARLIAIAGGSGSGKSWLARRLRRRLGGEAGLLSLDDFYRDLAGLDRRARDQVNFDDPAAIDWELCEACLRRIQAGEPCTLPRYNFTTHTRRPEGRCWRPRPVVLVEGLWPLHQARLRGLFALSVFVACAPELRLARRVERDQRERGRTRASVLRQFEQHVGPMHDRFVAPQRRWADVVLTSPTPRASVTELVTRIAALVR